MNWIMIKLSQAELLEWRENEFLQVEKRVQLSIKERDAGWKVL